MQKNYVWYSDPGHAWLQVPKADIFDMGILPKISQFSYIDSGFMYLEEDCDAALAYEAAKRLGWEIVTTEKSANNSSPVRRKARHNPATVAK